MKLVVIVRLNSFGWESISRLGWRSRKSVPVGVMKTKPITHGGYGIHRGAYKAMPPRVEVSLPKPFQPLTRDESMAVLENAIHWLMDETSTMLAMPIGSKKEHCRAELLGRERTLSRDLERLVRGK